MNRERWPGEHLIARMSEADRVRCGFTLGQPMPVATTDEIQNSNMRRWLGRKRREKFAATHKAPAKKYDMTGKRVA